MRRVIPWQAPDVRIDAEDPSAPWQQFDALDERLRRGPTDWYAVGTICRDAREAIAVARDIVARLVGDPKAHAEPLAHDRMLRVRAIDLDAARAIARRRDDPPGKEPAR